jgi:hypothetical protein
MIWAADSLPSISWMRPFDEALTVLGRVVFGVLAQIALRAGLGNRIDDPGSVDRLEPMQFGLQLFGAALGDGYGGHFEILQKETAERCRPAVSR